MHARVHTHTHTHTHTNTNTNTKLDSCDTLPEKQNIGIYITVVLFQT